jgi:hypothetical protein
VNNTRRSILPWLSLSGLRSGSGCCIFSCLSLLLVLHFPTLSLAQSGSEDCGDPQLLSVFPTGGERGKTVQAEIRGSRLAGAYAVWFDTDGLKARLLRVEEVNGDSRPKMDPPEKQPKPQTIYTAAVEIKIEPTTRAGVYPLRFVSPCGLSNPVSFPVIDEPLVVEAPGSHQTAELAQAVTLPAVISGKIAEPGEQDYYSFSVRKGEQLQFETIRGQKTEEAMAEGKFAQFTPLLALYHAGGSWFDPHRPTRLLFREERSSDLMQEQSHGSYRFDEDGQYLLQVSGVFGQGCPDCTYQVRVSSGEETPELETQLEEPRNEWPERSFARKLPDDWITKLEARAVQGGGSKTQAENASSAQGGNSAATAEPRPTPTPDLASHPVSVVKVKPNDGVAQPQVISIPAVLEGAIERPGELDSFQFKVEAGQKLAFEVETPKTKPPYFNPRLGIVDSNNQELFSNVERRLSMFNNNADPQVYLKDVEPKAVFTFEHGGEYVLQVRDITSRYGGPNYRYRIFVRPEIPHLGQILVTDGQTKEGAKPTNINRLNLTPGQPTQLTLIASYEEGFAGSLSFVFTGLPEGVQSFPGVQFHQDRPPLEVTQNPEIVAPKVEEATIVLLAVPDAKLTSEPIMVQLHCQLIADGKLGPSLLVQQVPLMVVAARNKEEQRSAQGK